MKPVLLVDLDDVAFDFMSELLRRYEGVTGRPLNGVRPKAWDFSPLDKDVCYSIFATPGFFACLQPMPGAVEALERLEETYEIVGLTHAVTPDAAAEKMGAWYRNFGYPLIVVSDAKAKALVRGDVLIDDRPLAPQEWKARNPDGLGVTIVTDINRQYLDGVDICVERDDPRCAWTVIADTLLGELDG